MLLEMRRQMEDLDKHGRRCNIRVRGVPELEGEKDMERLLTRLFCSILQEDTLNTMELIRAQLLPRLENAAPRDLICCLGSYKLKDNIMRKACSRQTCEFQGAQVALINNLSSLTLEAKWALQPVTIVLQERRIPYRWGFPPCTFHGRKKCRH
ncbi:Hypothetical predicted protein [Pelobates cultripes]|uniref:Uncharacterized protein n=1 Tax=Pelobates cultripes TaxID=61616 RepID=A0AAD1SF41_PELCU|nr:Hypothetical predicted protein [Pelobates cultripes]